MDLVYYKKSQIPTWFREIDNEYGEIGITKLPEHAWKLKTRPEDVLIKQGKIFAILEFRYFAIPLQSPITGVITAINSEVKEKPFLLNENPYHHWIIKIKPSRLFEDLNSKELTRN